MFLFTIFASILFQTPINLKPTHHTVYLVSPNNNSYTNQDNDTLDFTFNHSGALTGTVNCTMYLDNTAVNYTTSVPANTNTVMHSNQSLTDATHYWWVNCTNGTDSESSIEFENNNRTLVVDKSAPYELFSCHDLIIENGSYVLIGNVSSDGTCFNIRADNITLSGNGYTINYSKSKTGYGVNITGTDNATIRDLNIFQENFSVSDAYGIYLQDTENNIIINNTISTKNTKGYGIQLKTASSNNISNNTIFTFGGTSYGLSFFSNCNDNRVTNNQINTTCSDCDGVYGGGVTNSNLSYNIISTTGSISEGMSFLASNTNDLIANTITTSGASSHGIYLYLFTSNNQLIDNLILVNGTTSYGMYFKNSITTNNISGGSIISNLSVNYYLDDVDATNTFSNIYMVLHKIYFADTSSWFKYNNDTASNIWLNTKISPASSLTRKNINWTQDEMKWNDTNSSAGTTTTYELTGLSGLKQYAIYNLSAGVQTKSYTLLTDSDGKLSFTILLDRITEIKVNRTFIEDVPPITVLNIPSDAGITNNPSVTFNCSAMDDYNLANITLYGNWSGGWHANETKTVTGITNSTEFTKTLSEGTYLWNCKTYDNSTNSTFAPLNYTYTLDMTAPLTINTPIIPSFGVDWIFWSWSNPVGGDIAYAEIYINGTFKVNTTNTIYNATGLDADTWYEFQARTVDATGNINLTWVNSTTKTNAVVLSELSSCQDLTVENGIYTLIADVSSTGTCFDISADNITLDGNGYTVTYAQSVSGYAIDNSGGYDNITIKNLDIVHGNPSTTYAYAIYGSQMTDSNITNNTITTYGSRSYGVFLYSSSDSNTINDNTITTTGADSYGLYLAVTSANTISNNTITTSGQNGYGIYLSSSDTNLLSNNTITTTVSESLHIYGNVATHYNQTIDETNLVHNKPIKYYFNISGATIENNSTWGMLYVTWSNNVTVRNITIVDADNIIFGNVTDSIIESSNISGFTAQGGILLYPNSQSNNITDNIIYSLNPSGYGIYVHTSNTNLLSNNTVTTSGSDGYGLYLEASNTNTLTNNTITTSDSFAHGIYFISSDTNTISNNVISTSGFRGHGTYLIFSATNTILNNNYSSAGSYGSGVVLFSSSDSNNLTDNNINISGSDGSGIYLYSSSGNSIVGGSVISKVSYDYYLRDAGVTNNFIDTNFTSSRQIYFYDNSSWFNYNNETIYDISLMTKVSSASNISRQLTDWTQNQMRWNDTNSTDNVTITYGLEGLMGTKEYRIYNTSQSITTNAYNLTTDSSGKLNFTILLDGDTEIFINMIIMLDYLPGVTLNMPQDNLFENTNLKTFNCSATDDYNLENITLYGNWSGGWHANETKTITGTSNSTTFTKTISEGTYLWNCHATDNSSNSTFADQNYTFTIDTTAPLSIAFLTNQSQDSSWIYWNWTNPTDSDFNHTEIYLNGTWQSNTSNNFYNATGLIDNTSYEINTMTVDNLGNTNYSWVNSTAKTLIDTIAPNSVYNLVNQSSGPDWIQWTWDIPSDSDLSHIEVWIDGAFLYSGYNNSYTATGLIDNASYMISLRTVDYVGNINQTWVNSTANTLYTDRISVAITPSNKTVSQNETFLLNVSVYDIYEPMSGMQAEITYDASLVSVNSITEGDLFSQDGAQTFFMGGTINNTAGEAGIISTVILGPFNVTTPETFIIINMTAKDTINTSYINLTNVVIGTPLGAALFTDIENGTINIIDTTAPYTISNLLNQSQGKHWIYWNWTNPIDPDFNHTEIYLNGTWQSNTTNNFYNASGLTDATQYELQIRTADNSGNINLTWVNSTVKTILDVTLPNSVVNLTNQSQSTNWIYWNWTNPIDSDFNHTEIYLNGTWQSNTSNNFYNASGLIDDTLYELQTRTTDNSGNINLTWVNSTAKTLPDITAPTITINSPTNTSTLNSGTTSTLINITTNENATCRYNTTNINSTYENSTNFTTIGLKTHTLTYLNLTDGSTYNLYYWCNDTKGNINQNATHHTFSVASIIPTCSDSIKNQGESDVDCGGPCSSCSTGGGTSSGSSGFFSSYRDTLTDNTTNLTVNITSEILDILLANETIINDSSIDSTMSDIQIQARQKIDYVRSLLTTKNNSHVVEMLNTAENLYSQGQYRAAFNLANDAETILLGADYIVVSVPIREYHWLYYSFIVIIIILVYIYRRSIRTWVFTLRETTKSVSPYVPTSEITTFDNYKTDNDYTPPSSTPQALPETPVNTEVPSSVPESSADSQQYDSTEDMQPIDPIDLKIEKLKKKLLEDN